jgi:hypothetical protein
MSMQLDDFDYYLVRVVGVVHLKFEVRVFLCGYTRALCYHTTVHPSLSPQQLWYQAGRSLLDWINPASPQLVLSDKSTRSL